MASSLSADTKYADAIATVKTASSDIADLTERLKNDCLNTSKDLEKGEFLETKDLREVFCVCLDCNLVSFYSGSHVEQN